MLVFLYVCMSILLFNPDNLKRTGYTKAQIFFGPELAKKRPLSGSLKCAR